MSVIFYGNPLDVLSSSQTNTLLDNLSYREDTPTVQVIGDMSFVVFEKDKVSLQKQGSIDTLFLGVCALIPLEKCKPSLLEFTEEKDFLEVDPTFSIAVNPQEKTLKVGSFSIPYFY